MKQHINCKHESENPLKLYNPRGTDCTVLAQSQVSLNARTSTPSVTCPASISCVPPNEYHDLVIIPDLQAFWGNSKPLLRGAILGREIINK